MQKKKRKKRHQKHGERIEISYFKEILNARFSVKVNVENSLISAGAIEDELGKFISAILNPHIDEAVRLGILKPLIENQPPK